MFFVLTHIWLFFRLVYFYCIYFVFFFPFAVSVLMKCFFFFFKQKAAYDRRISDWSSDVFSSDLGGAQQVGDIVPVAEKTDPAGQRRIAPDLVDQRAQVGRVVALQALAHGPQLGIDLSHGCAQLDIALLGDEPAGHDDDDPPPQRRSEERRQEEESVSTCIYLWQTCTLKKKKKNIKEIRKK